MCAIALTSPARFDRLIPLPNWLGEVVVRVSTGVLARQFAVAVVLSALAIAAMVAAVGRAGAADLTVVPDERALVQACPGPKEIVVLYDDEGRPTVPARAPYYYCVTGTTLLPGEIPPPPEYCCG